MIILVCKIEMQIELERCENVQKKEKNNMFREYILKHFDNEKAFYVFDKEKDEARLGLINVK